METSLPRSSSESFMYFPLFTRGRWTFQPQVQKSLFLGKSITFSTKTSILKFSLKYPQKWKNHHKKRCVYTRNFMLVLKNLFLFCPKICSKHRTRKLQTCSFFFFFSKSMYNWNCQILFQLRDHQNSKPFQKQHLFFLKNYLSYSIPGIKFDPVIR